MSTKGLESYRERNNITEPWETRERVLVAITGAPGTEALIRRAARMAQRTHGELLGVHVRNDDGLSGSGRSDAVERHRQLLTDLGGEYHEVVASDIAAALAELARVENCTQLVLGASRRSRWAELTRGSVINRVIRLSGPIDLHVISQDKESARVRDDGHRRRFVGRASALSPRRRLCGPRDRGDRTAALDADALARARRPHAGVGVAAVLAAGGRDRGHRWADARDRNGGCRVPVRQLLLHAAVPHVHDRASTRTCWR